MQKVISQSQRSGGESLENFYISLLFSIFINQLTVAKTNNSTKQTNYNLIHHVHQRPYS